VVPIYALGDHEPQIHPDAYVHPDAVIIGRVRIGPESSVWPSAVLRGDVEDIVIGAGTSIQDGSVLHTAPGRPTVVGDDCVIGHLVHLEGCVIEAKCLVGSNAVVLQLAVVRTGALVAASALVPGGMEVPSGATAMGVPAKIRPDSADAALIAMGAESYRQRAREFTTLLRRVD
jgi:carbonic anhydrase/acetyltransferase-like protein (isoleucine patch superfamily)